MYRAVAGAVVLVAAVFTLHCSAQDFVMRRPNPVFHGEIIGPDSREANAADWPSTFVFKSSTGNECTATAISAQVILTAAHCSIKPLAAGTVDLDTSTHKANCQQHTAYATQSSADFALCLVDPPLPTPATGFEVVNKNASATPTGAPIKLLGSGCRYPGGVDQQFGRLSEGDATILEAKADYLLTGGGSAICFGDSGGGAYIAVDSAGIQRRLVAINSFGDIRNLSWLSVTASSIFAKWARQWCHDHQVMICGLHPSARGCHQ